MHAVVLHAVYMRRQWCLIHTAYKQRINAAMALIERHAVARYQRAAYTTNARKCMNMLLRSAMYRRRARMGEFDNPPKPRTLVFRCCCGPRNASARTCLFRG